MADVPDDLAGLAAGEGPRALQNEPMASRKLPQNSKSLAAARPGSRHSRAPRHAADSPAVNSEDRCGLEPSCKEATSS
jgi:hypothetical protein